MNLLAPKNGTCNVPPVGETARYPCSALARFRDRQMSSVPEPRCLCRLVAWGRGGVRLLKIQAVP